MRTNVSSALAAHAIHPCGGLADAYRAMLFYQLAFQCQHIAGYDLTAEAGVLLRRTGRLAAVFRQA